jgi:hypothetical protein
MGMFKRQPIVLTCSLILLLATVEAGVAWHYLEAMQAQHLAEQSALEHELASKTVELNRIIFLRDAENRAAAATQARAKASTESTADDELAEAAARAMSIPMGSAPRGRGSDELAELEEANELGSELTPGDIDPKHLVNMVNIMTGKKIAELTTILGATLIRYNSPDQRLGEDEPIWQVLDAVKQAHALKEVLLVGQGPQDTARLTTLKRLLVESGVPARLIRVVGSTSPGGARADDSQYRGSEGILLSLNSPSKRRRS